MRSHSGVESASHRLLCWDVSVALPEHVAIPTPISSDRPAARVFGPDGAGVPCDRGDALDVTDFLTYVSVDTSPED